MELDNTRMATSDNEHGDDDIEIDIDIPQDHMQDASNNDVMVDDISVNSEHPEDADMLDGDEGYGEDGGMREDEPMEYYDEDIDAPIPDAPAEPENVPDEVMTAVDEEETEGPAAQETAETMRVEQAPDHTSFETALRADSTQQLEQTMAGENPLEHSARMLSGPEEQAERAREMPSFNDTKVRSDSAKQLDETMAGKNPMGQAIHLMPSAEQLVQPEAERPRFDSTLRANSTEQLEQTMTGPNPLERGAELLQATQAETEQATSTETEESSKTVQVPGQLEERDTVAQAASKETISGDTETVQEQATVETAEVSQAQEQPLEPASQAAGQSEVQAPEGEKPFGEAKSAEETQETGKSEAPEGQTQGNDIPDASLALHDVKVLYQDHEMYLFPPLESEGNDTFLLKDESIAGQPVSTLLRACRDVLGEHITPQEELFLDVECLGLYLTETPSQPYTMSFYQLVEVYLQLCANDGLTVPEPIYVSLHSRMNINSEYANLVEAAHSGKGLAYVQKWEDEAFEDEGQEDEYPVQSEHEGTAEGKGNVADLEKQIAQEQDEGAPVEERREQVDEGQKADAEDQQAAHVETQDFDVPTKAVDASEQLNKEGSAQVSNEGQGQSQQEAYAAQSEAQQGEELYSDLGDQTVAEYEGDERAAEPEFSTEDRQQARTDNEKLGTEGLANEGPDSSVTEQPAPEDDEEANAPAEDEGQQQEEDEFEDDQEAYQDFTNEEDDAEAQGDNANAEVDLTNEDDMSNPNTDESYDNQEQQQQDIAETEQTAETAEHDDAEADVAEYEDDAQEADSDGELEEPLEGIDDEAKAHNVDDEAFLGVDDNAVDEGYGAGPAENDLATAGEDAALAEDEDQVTAGRAAGAMDYIGPPDVSAPAHAEEVIRDLGAENVVVPGEDVSPMDGQTVKRSRDGDGDEGVKADVKRRRS